MAGQRRIEAIFSSSVDAICVINEEGLIESFNATAQKLVWNRSTELFDRAWSEYSMLTHMAMFYIQFGYKDIEVLGQNVSILMPRDIARAHQSYIERYLQSGEYAQGRAVGKNRKVM